MEQRAVDVGEESGGETRVSARQEHQLGELDHMIPSHNASTVTCASKITLAIGVDLRGQNIFPATKWRGFMDEAVLCALQQQCALSLATHHFHLETYSNRFFLGAYLRSRSYSRRGFYSLIAC